MQNFLIKCYNASRKSHSFKSEIRRPAKKEVIKRRISKAVSQRLLQKDVKSISTEDVTVLDGDDTDSDKSISIEERYHYFA